VRDLKRVKMLQREFVEDIEGLRHLKSKANTTMIELRQQKSIKSYSQNQFSRKVVSQIFFRVQIRENFKKRMTFQMRIRIETDEFRKRNAGKFLN
jgi:hypothetical protein